MEKQYRIRCADSKAIENLSLRLGVCRVTASILANRDLVDAKTAGTFLDARLESFPAPFGVTGMQAAVKRIYRAIVKKEKIVVFGDYDVDGITATACLLQFFRGIGTDAGYYIPHRRKEGYGLKAEHVKERLGLKKGDLIITVDCGIGSFEAVSLAEKAGIDIVITDHHEIGENIPPACAVVNPKRADCEAGFDDLAGVGVAFLLIICLRSYLREKNYWKKSGFPEPNLKSVLDLVALGTLADMVPINLANRILSKRGMDIIGSAQRKGLKALIQVCRMKDRQVVSDDVVFRLAPRLNAAGRMEHAKTSLELLLTEDEKKAQVYARILNDINSLRQRQEKEIYEEILEYIKCYPYVLNNKTLVLSRDGWHEGVLGIVASRIANEYFRPTILISKKDEIGVGSGRSIPGVDILEAIRHCESDLIASGGHCAAVGITVAVDALERFKDNFENAVRRISTENDFIAQIAVDCEIDFDDISETLLDELETLQPFGPNNPEPLFVSRNVKVSYSRMVGGSHRKMSLYQELDGTGKKSRTFSAIEFNCANPKKNKEEFETLLYRLRWNRYNGAKTIQIVVEK